jgi:hypothetical protein
MLKYITKIGYISRRKLGRNTINNSGQLTIKALGNPSNNAR